jgi:3-hydroxyisobutyrate dehydrogenase-like beta-hydroxyacid dehydrogenase
MSTIGLLHPGAMGASIGAALQRSGARVQWCSAGRSAETRQRADAARLQSVSSLAELAATSDVVLSVCPPDAALPLARSVVEAGFRGVYVDANAVSRATAQAIERELSRVGATCVDGGILGPPVQSGKATLLWLSGARAEEVAALFAGSELEARIVGATVGQASALKMAFAAWTKGSTALLTAVRALADAEGVGDALLESWARLSPELTEQSLRSAAGAAPKAWRWVGEMHEIAASFEAVGLPGGFHRAAADVYERLATFKVGPVSFEAILARLRRPR